MLNSVMRPSYLKGKTMKSVTLMFLLLSVGWPFFEVSGQDFSVYRLDSLPDCTHEQSNRFMNLLIGVAAFQAVGDTPKEFVDVVRSAARDRLQESLAGVATDEVGQNRRNSVRSKLIDALRKLESEPYVAMMHVFWNEPIACRQAFETIQRVNELSLAAKEYLLLRTAISDDPDLIEIAYDVAYEQYGNPQHRIGGLVDFFINNS